MTYNISRWRAEGGGALGGGETPAAPAEAAPAAAEEAAEAAELAELLALRGNAGAAEVAPGGAVLSPRAHLHRTFEMYHSNMDEMYHSNSKNDTHDHSWY
jgi:hypothetical protein